MEDGKIIQRRYENFRGVDFSSDDTKVNLSRSPNAINVWKDYNSSLGQAIETRVGFRILKHKEGKIIENFEYKSKVLKLHTFKIDNKPFFLIHMAEYDVTKKAYVGKLYQWTNYPNDNAALQIIENDSKVSYDFSNTTSCGFIFEKTYYILDGIDYYGIELKTITENQVSSEVLRIFKVSERAYVPTTYTVTRDGQSKAFQPMNKLTGKQKVELSGNASKTEYLVTPFDISEPTEDVRVEINGKALTAEEFTFNDLDLERKLTFKLKLTKAPKDNDVIVVSFRQKFKNKQEILNCEKAVVFDNRVFFAGSKFDKTKYLFSALNDATYVPYYNFEHAGKEEIDVTSLMLIANGILLIKDGSGQDGYIYSITARETKDENMPKAYANSLVSSSIGGVTDGINFLNDIVFLTKQGLKAISRLDLHNERNIEHRSSLVDGKLINEKNLETAKMAVFRNYLFILINGRMYLADSRQVFSSNINQNIEYEWYFWENIGVYQDGVFNQATELKEFDGKLFFGTENGCLCVFNTDFLKLNAQGLPIGSGELLSRAYQDDCLIGGEKKDNVIYSCWSTPFDDFNYRNRFKRCNKRGAMADLKSFAHSIAKIAIKTNSNIINELKRHNGGYFDFSDMDFEDFTFNTDAKNVLYFKPKNKKWERISFMFYSDEIRKPFGIYGTSIEAYVMGYAKER